MSRKQPFRRTTRHAVSLECRALAENGDRFFEGKTLDVSTEGLRILSEAKVVVGEPVVLALRLPRQATWIDAHARVARIEEGVRDGDPGRAIALEFTAMDHADRYRLYYSTQALPPPMPRRASRSSHLRQGLAS